MRVEHRLDDGRTVSAVKRCVCRTEARREEEGKHPGGFTAAGAVARDIADSRLKIQDSRAESEDSREQASDAEIAGTEGIRYAAARVARLDIPDREVGMLLLNHRGRERAIKIADIIESLPSIAWPTNLYDSAREVKKIVARLRTLARVPIAATKEPPYGYFIPITPEECREMHDRFFREGVKLIVQAQLFARDKNLAQELEGQMRISEQ